MRCILEQRNEGAVVILPYSILKAAHLEPGQVMEVRVAGDAVVVVPVRSTGKDHESLLDGVTDENLHREIDMG
jgi:antitoxin component of MazEF toxin-antitoxin module